MAALKLLTLRNDDMCARCSARIAAGSTAWWDPSSGSLICAVCEPVQQLCPVPQPTTSWTRGAAARRRLARGLDVELVDDAIILHDRTVPGARGDIDHIVVSAAGVWLVDARTFSGRVRRRGLGGWSSGGDRLIVGKHNCTKLVDAMGWQVAAVRAQLDYVDLGELPVHPVVCLTSSTWGWLAKPFRVGDVLVTWPAALITAISNDRADRLLDGSTIDLLAAHLGSSLPASSASSR